jgi:hypothetical protein
MMLYNCFADFARLKDFTFARQVLPGEHNGP